MAVAVPLIELRRQLRAEVGQSLNPLQGVNAQGQYDIALARQQQELWEAYEWPHLSFNEDIPLQAGQRYYDYPAALPFDAVNKAWVLEGTSWVPLNFGIRMPDYTDNGGEDTRSWPVRRWANRVIITNGKVAPSGKIEVLPVPSQNGVLRLAGQAPCNPLIADTDICVLDSTLVVLYAASEILAERKSESSALKLQKAQQYLRRVLANQGGDKRGTTVLGGAQIAAVLAPRMPGDGSRRFRV